MTFNAQPEIAKPQRRWSTWLAFIGVLTASVALVGLTSANLSVEKKESPTMHDVYSPEVNYSANYTADTGKISAPLGLGSPSTSATIKVTNDGDISQNMGWGVDPASLVGLDLDNPIYEQTKVVINLTSDAPGAGLARTDGNTYTLKQFFTEAFITDLVIAPGQTMIVPVLILPSTESSWNSTELANAVNQTFGTHVRADQIINGTSPLVDYAKTNGTPVFSQSNIEAWSIPAAELTTIPVQ